MTNKLTTRAENTQKRVQLFMFVCVCVRVGEEDERYQDLVRSFLMSSSFFEVTEPGLLERKL